MTGWMGEGIGEWGGRPVARTVATAGPRQRAVLAGTVVEVFARRRSGTTATAEALLDDGTGTVVLRWSGRDHVPGVVVGAQLLVEGTVLGDRGRLVLLNPLYRFT